MIRSKTFCKFFQIQSSFPLQSFLKKKRISAAIWARSLLPFLFTLPIFCQIKKNWHKFSFINYQNYFFFEKWMKIDIAFLRNAINIWQKFLHTSRSYGTKNHRINKSTNHHITASSHRQISASSNYHIKIPTFTIQAFIFW